LLDHVFTDAIGALRDAMENALLERQAFEERFQVDVLLGDVTWETSYGLPGEGSPPRVRADLTVDWPTWSQTSYRNWYNRRALRRAPGDPRRGHLPGAAAVDRPDPTGVLAVLPESSPLIGNEMLERSWPTVEQVYGADLESGEFAIELSYEGTIPLEESTLADGSALDEQFKDRRLGRVDAGAPGRPEVRLPASRPRRLTRHGGGPGARRRRSDPRSGGATAAGPQQERAHGDGQQGQRQQHDEVGAGDGKGAGDDAGRGGGRRPDLPPRWPVRWRGCGGGGGEGGVAQPLAGVGERRRERAAAAPAAGEGVRVPPQRVRLDAATQQRGEGAGLGRTGPAGGGDGGALLRCLAGAGHGDVPTRGAGLPRPRRRRTARAGSGRRALALGLLAAPALVVVLEVVVVAAAVVAVLVGEVEAAAPARLVRPAVAAIGAAAVVVRIEAERPCSPLPRSTERSLPDGCRLSPASTTLFGVPPSLASRPR
jgi:hypothetical protein